MAAEVLIYQTPSHHRSITVTQAMEAGINRVGDRCRIIQSTRYLKPESQCAVFYGLAGRLQRVFDDYRRSPDHTAVYIDLGYWGRKQGGRFNGFHKISVDARHPTAYFQNRPHDKSRADVFGLDPEPWRKGKSVLLCGMGPKGANAEGYVPNEWERGAAALLKRHTARPIIYRPKPNWATAKAIPGTTFVHGANMDMAEALAGSWAVVAHHSNACVEALVAGIPVFTMEGVAEVQGSKDLTQIESPVRLETRRQWINDVAWTQWSIAEMAAGLPWRHLKEEGLVP